MDLEKFISKIRRRETPFYNRLYKWGKTIQGIEFPVTYPVHKLLYYERKVRRTLWKNFLRVCYYEPMFKTVCQQVGKNLMLVDGIPLVIGDLKIFLGDHVTISGVTTFCGAKVFDDPVLKVGSNSYIGYQVGIYVGKEVTIGNNVLIAHRVDLIGYDLHPIDPHQRRQNLPASQETSKPIIIEDDVWICAGSTILKGATVHRGAIVSANSVVTDDVPPYTIVGGNPAKVVKELTSSLAIGVLNFSGIEVKGRES